MLPPSTAAFHSITAGRDNEKFMFSAELSALPLRWRSYQRSRLAKIGVITSAISIQIGRQRAGPQAPRLPGDGQQAFAENNRRTLLQG